MATVKGQNLRVYVGSRTIIAALDCQLNVQLNVQPYSTKDDEGSWTKNRAVKLQWSVTANAAVTDEQELDAIGVSELADLIGQTVRVQLNTSEGEKNREATEHLLAGNAILSDVQITAANRLRATAQITLTGKANMLIDLRYLVSSDGHYLRSADGHVLTAPHEE
jgi:hypothetical protein